MLRITMSLGVILLAPCALAVQDCDVNGVSVNPANGNTTRGKTGMMRCRDHDSGQVEREQELRNGESVGLVRYYRDGWLEREFSVNEKGNHEGRAREFHPGGQVVAREEAYRNGTVVGISRTWHANNALKRLAVRDDDGGELAYVEFTERGQLRELHCADRPVMGKARWPRTRFP